MKRDFQVGDRVIWTSPRRDAPIAGKIADDRFRSLGAFTLDLDNGRKEPALQEHLQLQPTPQEHLPLKEGK